MNTYIPRNTTMLKEQDLFNINATKNSASPPPYLNKKSSDSLSEDIEKNMSRRNSIRLSRKMTPSSKSLHSRKMQIKPSLTLNDLSNNRELLSTITNSHLLLNKKRRTNPNTRLLEEKDNEAYYICESKKIADSQLDILRRSMQKSKNQKSFVEEKTGTESLSRELKKEDYCTKEQVEKLLTKREIRINTYFNGSYLGDEEICLKSNRIYNCRAKTDVELMVLTKADFELYLHQEFPHVYEKIIKYAKEKQDHNEAIVKKLVRRIQASAKHHELPIKNVLPAPFIH